METLYPNGGLCKALFQITDDTKKTARETGYGSDVMAMHREHDLAHTYLAEVQGQRYSPVLFEQAGGIKLTKVQRELEEKQVLAFQRYCQTGEIAEVLYDVADHLPKWKTHFRQLSDQLWKVKDEKSE